MLFFRHRSLSDPRQRGFVRLDQFAQSKRRIAVVGAELETVAFLSEFPSVLVEAAGDGFVLEVRDGSGGALFKTGATPEKQKPDAVFALSSALPHRTLALWRIFSWIWGWTQRRLLRRFCMT